MKKQYLLLLLIVVSMSCCTSTNVSFGVTNKGDDVFIKGTQLSGETNKEIEFKIFDITGKNLFRPICSYPETIAMLKGEKIRSSAGIDHGWWMFAKHPKTKQWSSVAHFTTETSFVSICRPRPDSVYLILCYKGEEIYHGYRWFETRYGYGQGWRETYCSRDELKRKK